MTHTSDPVATWRIWHQNVVHERFSRAALRELVTLSGEALDVLHRHRLLIPREVVLDEWVPDGGGAAEQDPVTARIRSGNRSEFRRVVENAIEKHDRLPVRIEVHGDTALFDADGKEQHDSHAVTLDAICLGVTTVFIRTHTDAWLPSDLYGRDQSAIYRTNAPRLSIALQDLAALPETTVEPAEFTTRYAEVALDGIDNIRDLHGTVIPVLDTE